MEIYMTRNATTRNGLVPLWEQFMRCRWYTDILLKVYNLNGIFWQPVQSQSIQKYGQEPHRSFIENNRYVQSAITSNEHGNIINDAHEELALYLINSNRQIKVMHFIETSYCETDCCFQYVRTTKTKTNLDRNTINTIEVCRGPRPSVETVNDSYI